MKFHNAGFISFHEGTYIDDEWIQGYCIYKAYFGWVVDLKWKYSYEKNKKDYDIYIRFAYDEKDNQLAPYGFECTDCEDKDQKISEFIDSNYDDINNKDLTFQ